MLIVADPDSALFDLLILAFSFSSQWILWSCQEFEFVLVQIGVLRWNPYYHPWLFTLILD